jgi:hypothetical protein
VAFTQVTNLNNTSSLRLSELCSAPSSELGLQNSQSTVELLELFYNRAFGFKFSDKNKF